jgi:hypothetical protein
MIILMSLLMFYLDVIILCCIFVFMLRMFIYLIAGMFIYWVPRAKLFYELEL